MLLPMNGYSSTESGIQSLIGSFPIDVSISVEEVGDLKKSQIMNDVELKLLQSNIKITDNSDYLLGIFVYSTKQPQIDAILYSVHIEFDQLVKLLDSRRVINTTTWSKSYYGITPLSKSYNVRDAVKDLLDEFLLDYLKANPVK